MTTRANTLVTPYPSKAEILRFLANVFDLEASNQQLKDYIKHGDSDFRIKDKIIEEIFINSFEKYASKECAAFFKSAINYFLKHYITSLVCEIRLDAINRTQAMELLCSTYFPFLVSILFRDFHNIFGGPAIESLLSSEHNSTIDAIFKWIETDHQEILANHAEILTDSEKKESITLKAFREKMTSWRRGSHQPNINFLIGELNLNKYDPSIIAYIYVARALDSIRFKQGDLGTLFYKTLVHYLNTNQDLQPLDIEKAHAEFDERFAVLNQADDNFMSHLELSKNRGQLKHEFENLVALHNKHDPEGRLNYRLELYYARSNSISKEDCLRHLVNAFEQSLYKGGEIQKELYQMAFSMATGMVSQKSIVTKLKNQAIAFSWIDEPAEYEQESSRTELLYGAEKTKNRKIDTKLIQYAINNDIDNARHILSKNKTSINSLSIDNKSVYLIAVEHLAYSDDDKLINLLLAHRMKPKPATINAKNDEGFTPLILAVQYGLISIVKELLELGADVSLKTAARTPLMLAVEQLLSCLKPEKLPKLIDILKKKDPRVREYLRRYLLANNLMPVELTHSELDAQIEIMLNHPRKIEIFKQVEHFYESKNQAKSEDYRQVIKLLLQNNANPNQAHEKPVLGYTPLMLAAETDDLEVFAQLLKFDGDPYNTARHFNTLEDIDCFTIAKEFKSTMIVQFLESSFPTPR